MNRTGVEIDPKGEKTIESIEKVEESIEPKEGSIYKGLSKSDYIVKLYTDLYESNIPIRKFARLLKEKHSIQICYTSTRNLLIARGVYTPGETPGPGKAPPGKSPEDEFIDEILELNTEELWDFYYNCICPARMGPAWNQVPEKEIKKLGKLTDKLLIKWLPFVKKWVLELQLGIIVLTISLPRMRKVIEWKRQRSRQSSENPDQESRT